MRDRGRDGAGSAGLSAIHRSTDRAGHRPRFTAAASNTLLCRPPVMATSASIMPWARLTGVAGRRRRVVRDVEQHLHERADDDVGRPLTDGRVVRVAADAEVALPDDGAEHRVAQVEVVARRIRRRRTAPCGRGCAPCSTGRSRCCRTGRSRCVDAGRGCAGPGRSRRWRRRSCARRSRTRRGCCPGSRTRRAGTRG